MPTVTVIIPVYNREKTIRRALDSVLSQTLPVHEIILVDDGSTDQTIDIINSYDVPVIKLICHEKNAGASAARNTGIQAATGKYIAFLDSDDCWMENKLEAQMAFIVRYGYDVCCTDFLIRYEGETGRVRRSARGYPDRLSMEEISYGCYVSPGSSLIATKESLLAIGGYDVRYKRYEDWDLLLKFLYEGFKIGYLRDDLCAIYVAHNFNPENALDGLSMIEEVHAAKVSEFYKSFEPNFISGLSFNRAATLLMQKKYVSGLAKLLESYVVQPRKNWLFRKILYPRLCGKIGFPPEA